MWLLQQGLSSLRTSVTDTALHSHIDNCIRNLLSINAVLRSLNIQVSYGKARFVFLYGLLLCCNKMVFCPVTEKVRSVTL